MRLFGFIAAIAALWASSVDAQPAPARDSMQGRFENGIRYDIRRVASPEHVATVRVVIAAGTDHETLAEAGLAHFLEHVITAQKSPDGSHLYVLGDLAGARFALAYANLLDTAYDLHFRDEAMNGLVPSLGSLLAIILHPTIDQAAVERERQAVIQEQFKGAQSRRDYSDELLRVMSGGAIAGQAATLSVTKSATPEVLRAFHRRTYRTERMGIVIVGDIDVQKTYAAVHDLVEAIPRSQGPMTPLPIHLRASRSTQPAVALLEHPEINRPLIKAVRLFWPDGAPRPIGSRSEAIIRLVEPVLNQRARALTDRTGAPSSNISVTFSSSELRSIPMIQLDAVNRSDRIGDSVQDIQAFADLLAREGLSEPEIEEAKRIYRNRIPEDAIDMFKRAHMTLVEDLAANIARPGETAGADEIARTIDGLTADEINKALASWFGRQPDYVIYSGPAGMPIDPKTGASIEATLKQPFPRLTRAMVVPPPPVLRLSRPLKRKACPSRHRAVGTIQGFDIDCSGIKLVVQARPAPDHRVRFQVTLPATPSRSPQEELRDRIALSAVMTYADWAGMDRFARRRFLASENIEMDMSFLPDGTGIQLWASAPEGKEALVAKLLGEALYDPKISDATFADMRIDKIADAVRSAMTSQSAEVSDISADPLDGSNPADVLARYRRMTREGRDSDWVVAGRTNASIIESEISRWSFGLPKSSSTYRHHLRSVAPIERETRSGVGPKATITIERLRPAPFDQGAEALRAAAMRLLDKRMMERLRTRENGVYGVTAQVRYRPSDRSEVVGITFETELVNEERLIRATKEELARLAETTLSGDELETVQRVVRDEWWLTPQAWLSRNHRAVSYGVPIEKLATEARAVSKQDIPEYFAKFLTDGVWQVTIKYSD